jgi:hypothetical protein
VIRINRLAVAYAERSVYFSGDAATRTMLSQISTGPRAPRSESVRSKQFRRPDEDGLYIAGYFEMPNVAFDVSWMTLWPRSARIPVSQRMGKFRIASVSMPKFSEFDEGQRPPFWDADPEE